MRRALVVVAVACAALVLAKQVFAKHSGTYGHAGALVSYGDRSGGHEIGFGSPDSTCETIGGDFSVSIPMYYGGYFHLVLTRKDHGNYRSVVWGVSGRIKARGVLLQPTITLGENAKGQTTGTFSGLSTKGLRMSGNFACV
jgi:hypothetical protein